MNKKVNVVICGAGIAGISAAYHLSVIHGEKDILLVDERKPLSLTSDKSTECYRNWWLEPENAMVSLMNRSIDWLERLADESGNIFQLNRRGYLFLTADSKKIPQIIKDAKKISQLGGGSLRIYKEGENYPTYVPTQVEGYDKSLTGADLFLSKELIRKQFPYLSKDIVAALHVRRAGWFSAQQLGQYLLEKCKNNGVTYTNQKIVSIEKTNNQVSSVVFQNGERIGCNYFVSAAGPFTKEIGNLMGIDIPVFSELHLKVSIHDSKQVVPRNSPLLIWTDEQYLPWSEEERKWFQGENDLHWLLNRFPGGAHTRPEGGIDSDIVLLLWEYKTDQVNPIFPVPLDPLYPEIAIRGMAAMLPRFDEYFKEIPKPIIDGGYYVKTQENRPLIGPLSIKNAYIIGGLSGFGLMASCAAGELLAAHILNDKLPTYADAFTIERYRDPAYQKMLKSWKTSGQL
ncbi:MAG: FAD-binding oxidoreductase [Anaerolineales bacterium]|nr:FAD-binding oxidoreductase [Anaerolineales bacterium]